MDQFYLTLPSNSSMDIFPNNTLTEYTTKLHRRLELHGSWEVALVEIQYPVSFYNVKRNKVYSHDKSTSKIIVGQIPVGYYHSMEHLLSVINRLPEVEGHASFKYNSVTGHVEFKTDETRDIFLIEGLAETLGYLPKKPVSVLSPQPASILHSIPSQLFVYTDIVEPQFVGDTVAPLLRIVGIEDATYQKLNVKIYNTPHYVPVLKRSFDTITVDIRTSTGHKVPFEFGTLTVKLHFRRRHESYES